MQLARRRRGGELTTGRARERASAYVYGNITTLGALAAVGLDAVEHGTAAVAVAATAVATFVAHVIAHAVAERIGADEQTPARDRGVSAELRDTLPIATSGGLPVLLLLLGALDLVAPLTAWVLAVAVVVVRLASTGLVIERISGRSASPTALWSGLVLAALSVAVAIGKAALTH